MSLEHVDQEAEGDTSPKVGTQELDSSRANGGSPAPERCAFKVSSLLPHGGTRNGDGAKQNGEEVIEGRLATGRSPRGIGTPLTAFIQRYMEREPGSGRSGRPRLNGSSGTRVASSVFGSRGRGSQTDEVSSRMKKAHSLGETVAGFVRDRAATGVLHGSGAGDDSHLAEWVKHGSGDDSDEGTNASR